MGSKRIIKSEVVDRIDIKEELFNIKKAKAKHSKELNYLNLRQIFLEKKMASRDVVQTLLLKINKLEKEAKKINDNSKSVSKLEGTTLREKEFLRYEKNISKEIEKLKNKLNKVAKSDIKYDEDKLKDVESKIIGEKRIKDIINHEISSKHLATNEISKELDKVKKEYSKLHKKISKIKREVINFQKERFLANTIILIALISLIGSAISINYGYFEAANFLGVESMIFLAIGLLIHLYVALRR